MMTHPDVALNVSQYRIVAMAFGRTLATAVRTLWGWHIPLAPIAGCSRWRACDSTDDAVTVVTAVAARRMGVGR